MTLSLMNTSFVIAVHLVSAFIVFKLHKRELLMGALVLWSTILFADELAYLIWSQSWTVLTYTWLYTGVFYGLAFSGVIYLFKLLFRKIYNSRYNSIPEEMNDSNVQKKVKKAPIWLLAVAFISSFIGYAMGIVISGYIVFAKDGNTSSTTEYIFDEKSRKSSKLIMVFGFFIFTIIMITIQYSAKIQYILNHLK